MRTRTLGIIGNTEPDPARERVLIHAVTDKNGAIVMPDGTPLPPLKPNTRVEIRTSAWSVEDRSHRAALRAPERLLLLPRGTHLLAAVHTGALNDPRLAEMLHQSALLQVLSDARERALGPRGLAVGGSIEIDQSSAGYGFLVLELLEDLHIERRGQKPYRLQRCRCVIPALAEVLSRRGLGPELPSLNQALTRASELLELTRATHTGSAFERCFAPQEPGSKTWVRLGWHRDFIEMARKPNGSESSGSHGPGGRPVRGFA